MENGSAQSEQKMFLVPEVFSGKTRNDSGGFAARLLMLMLVERSRQNCSNCINVLGSTN